MKSYVKPAPVAPSGRPECAPLNDHWTHHWTVADCLKHFEVVPAIFRVFEPTSTVASIWHYLTIGMQSKLDVEFVSYDIRTGRI